MVIPSAGCSTFELCTGVLIVGELCLANKILYASGGAVALLHRQLNIAQAAIVGPSPRVHVPCFVDRPELFFRNEFPETFHGRNLFVVTLFSNRADGGGVFSAEPVTGRTPAIRAFHSNAVPKTIAARVFSECRHRVHHGVLPVQRGEQLIVFRTNGFRRQTIACIRPHECRCVRAEHQNLRTKAFRGDTMVLVIPLVPFLPLIAAHPPAHDRDTLLVGEFNDMFAGDLRLPAEEVDSEILDIAQDVGFPLRIEAIEKIRRIVGTADQKIPSVHLQIEIAPLAQFRE